MKTRILPNFLVVGAQRCGTTYLWGLLRQHPEIFLTKQKEPQYFGELLIDKNYPLSVYEQHFLPVKNEKAIGEATVENMYLDGIAPLIYRVLGPIRLMFLLRNPIDRAYSHYWMMVSTRREFKTFEKAIEAEEIRMKKNFYSLRNYSYVHRGYYFEQVQRFLPYFHDQMFYLISKYLYNDTERVLVRVCEFLNVDPDFSFEKNVERYDLPIPKRISLFRLLNFIHLTIKGRPGYWKVAPFIRLQQNNLLKDPIHYPPMSLETREYLRGIYQESNSQLENFLNMDLSFWK